MADCIFCMIAEGKIPSSKIYESDTVYAFLDLNPVHKGHALVIPKKHAKDLLRLSPELGCDLVLAMQKVGRAVMEATGADGFNVIQNNGHAAGQEVEHVHWHIIPRFDGDGLKFWAQTKYESMEAMNAMAEQIRAKIV